MNGEEAGLQEATVTEETWCFVEQQVVGRLPFTAWENQIKAGSFLYNKEIMDNAKTER
jgi:hypothetical protein